jgi:dihydropteroate synthase
MAEVVEQLADPACAPLIMGVLNVTPDSFSDGGRFATVDDALDHGHRMLEEGALILDVGGESSRPGSQPVADDLQIARVVPVIEALRARLGWDYAISIDTRSVVVAAAALAAGATIVNDISAAADPAMLSVVAARKAAIVLMHMQGTPDTMQIDPRYDNVTAEVRAFLDARAALALRAGIPRERIVVDPGIGFGKTRAHNLQLLRDLPQFVDSGFPVMLGTSRKRFMGAICRETTPHELIGATCATTALGTIAGIRVFRVHDVRQNRQAMEVAWATQREIAG